MTHLDTIWASKLEGTDALDYDRFVLEAPSGHFAQTRAWAPVAEASRPCRVRYFLAREAGRVVGAALVMRASVGPLVLPFARVDRGPVCARAVDTARVLEALAQVARDHGVVRLEVMPYWAHEAVAGVEAALHKTRFQDVQRTHSAHAASLRIDLAARSDEELLKGADRAPLRRMWREAVRAGATVRRGNRVDLETHRRLARTRLPGGTERDRASTWYDALWAWLDATGHGAIFVCEAPGGIVGTVVALRHGRLATYALGATTSAPCPFSKSVLPLVAAVRWAKAEGCLAFDLGGVPTDDDGDPKRLAIAHYKRHFSRTRVELVREHARWF
jgi:hypothetical protein